MPNYSVANSTILAGATPNSITATYQTILAVAPSTGNNANTFSNPSGLRRGKLYDLLVGTAGTPADFSYEWEVVRATVGTTPTMLGSMSSVSSGAALDLADPGFAAFVFNNSSAETNIAAVSPLWYVGINQRASYRWVAAPGSELIYPAQSSATAANGLALKARSVSGGTAVCAGSLMFLE